jgi:hypothetical protein
MVKHIYLTILGTLVGIIFLVYVWLLATGVSNRSIAHSCDFAGKVELNGGVVYKCEKMNPEIRN